ncbi:MAG: fumarylacetoacetase [Balneolales bacterium]
MPDTTGPLLHSFIPVRPGSHFPIQNLPYGVFQPLAGGEPRIGTAIGEYVLDLAELEKQGFFEEDDLLHGTGVFAKGALNAFMKLGRPAWTQARERLSRLLRSDEAALRDNAAIRKAVFFRHDEVLMKLPADIGDYTDFYSSKEHAANVGTMFRGADKALMPNWLYLPVGYHGRSSSVVASGAPVYRPSGQTKGEEDETPVFGPSKLLDFELEMGFFTGPGNELGKPIPADEAENHIFGMVIVNDWSARDIQKWEYVPLGPFLSKDFCTSVSPWVVTLDALEPFRTVGPRQDPEPLAYLQTGERQTYDIELEVMLRCRGMDEDQRICRSNFRYLYWSMVQQLAHQTITGCNVRPGDLYASGTISGPDPESYGSMLELTWRGSRPLKLPTGEERKFLHDGDTVTMTGWCEGDGYTVGFGEVTGEIR